MYKANKIISLHSIKYSNNQYECKSWKIVFQIHVTLPLNKDAYKVLFILKYRTQTRGTKGAPHLLQTPRTPWRENNANLVATNLEFSNVQIDKESSTRNIHHK